MADNQLPNPALGFATYAANAATTAIVALSREGLIGRKELDALLKNLAMSRQLVGSDPHMVALFDGLDGILQIAENSIDD